MKNKTFSTSGTILTECQHSEESKLTHIYQPAQNSTTTRSKTNIKRDPLNPIGIKVENNLEFIKIITQALRAKINKWDFMK